MRFSVRLDRVQIFTGSNEAQLKLEIKDASGSRLLSADVRIAVPTEMGDLKEIERHAVETTMALLSRISIDGFA